jgi:hypothetical protein
MSFRDWLNEVDAVARDPRAWAYPIEALGTMAPEERSTALDALVMRARQGDAKAIEALAEPSLSLSSSERRLTEDALEVARRSGHAWARAAAVRALAKLQGGQDLARLATHDDAFLRGLGAYELKVHPDPATVPLLLGLLMDADTVVRVHASEGVIEKLGLGALNTGLGSPINRLDGACASQRESRWRPACAELEAIAEAIILGADPASLDLVYVPSADPGLARRFLVNAGAWLPHDVEMIRQMSPHDRRWAESVLLGRLDFPDIHAIDALAELDPPGWREQLAEVVAGYSARGEHPDFVARGRAALANVHR